MRLRKLLLALACTVAGVAIQAQAQAQTQPYPSKPLRLVVTFPPDRKSTSLNSSHRP